MKEINRQDGAKEAIFSKCILVEEIGNCSVLELPTNALLSGK
jgi:hypothetical protein